MESVRATSVLRYFEPLDRFLEVNELAPDQIQGLLHAARPRDRFDYYGMVLRCCLPQFQDDIAPSLEETFDPEFMPDVHVSLYRFCIAVNPALDIHEVSLPAAGPGHCTPAAPEQAGQTEAAPQIERERLRDLSDRLRRRVVGQDGAIERVTRVIRKGALGLRDPRRPMGTFLFAGPTGVGKTELAKSLADSLFGDAQRLVRVDCSELAQSHDYARLIGSPPGYVGYGEGGMLTEALRKQPNAVVLFDEIEKADPTLHNLLLQVLDEGRLTDGRGQTVSLRQAVIVMTSNIGAAEVRALENRAGFATGGASAPVCATRHAATMRALEDSFAPEFLNRLDDVLVFRPLSVDDAEAIVDRLIAQFRGRLRRLGYRLRVSAEARRAVAQRGWSHTYGAREIARALQRLVEDPIAERIVNDDAAAVTRFFLHVADGEVRVRSAA